MGVSSSLSLSKLRENNVLQRFVGDARIERGDELWNHLITFSYTPPTHSKAECKLLEEAARPLLERLVRTNHGSGNLRTFVTLCLERAAVLDKQENSESDLSWSHVYNGLLLIRLSLKYILETQSEKEAILHLDGSTTLPQLTSLESHPHTLTASQSYTSTTSASTTGTNQSHAHSSTPSHNHKEDTKGKSSSASESVSNPIIESLAKQTANSLLVTQPLESSVTVEGVNDTKSLLSWQLVEGVVSLLCNVKLDPLSYYLHLEAVNLLLVLLSPQVRPQTATGVFLRHILTINKPSELLKHTCEMAAVLIGRLLDHVISQPLSPHTSQGSSLLSSVTSGLWSLVTLNTGVAKPDSTHSALAEDALLLLLVLTQQQARGHNPYRLALASFSDERGDKGGSFSLNLEKIYLTICRKLSEESYALLLYLLLQSNPNVASFLFSRSDIEHLVLPLLRQLHDCGEESSHHVYMLLITLLILSQDDCFNKSIHEKVIPSVPWYTDRKLSNIPLGSLIVMVLVKTVQINLSHIRDKYLHTNCLAALANMSSQLHSLHLDAARKMVNLFKALARKHQRVSERLSSTPSTPTTPSSPEPLLDSDSTDRVILEEVLQMVLEIINSCLTHTLHNNPHLVYCLLYQREIFEPYRTHPSLVDLVQNIETVVAFFASKLEQSGPSPYSSEHVLATIEQTAKAWPRNRLRLFPELKFRYVEEDQPEAFFIPYIWTMVFKHSSIYWDSSKVHFAN